MSQARQHVEAELVEGHFLGFKILARENVRLAPKATNSEAWTARTSLFAVSNTLGWFVAGRDTGFVLSPTRHLRAAFKNPKAPFEPRINVDLAIKPTSIKFACNSERLIVAQINGAISIYDTTILRDMNYTGTLPLLITLTHHSVPILDIQPNPFDKPELVAVLRGNPTEPTNGTQIEMIDVRTMMISFSWPVVGLGQTQLCMCWSPKGKQIVVGNQSGELIQHTADGTVKATVARPSASTLQPSAAATSVMWMENTIFHVMYTISASPGTPSSESYEAYTILAEKTGTTDIHISDPAPPWGDRSRQSARFYLHLRDWTPMKHTLIVADPPSTDIGIVYCKQDPTSPQPWGTLDVDERERAALPTDEEGRDTYALGVDLDLTSVDDVVMATFGGDETPPVPAAPILFIYTNTGEVVAYHVLNSASPSCPSMVSGGAASTTPTAAPTPAPAPSAFGGAQPSSGFVQSSFGQPAQPAFGKPSFGQLAFGQPSFGQPSFGQTSVPGSTSSPFSSSPTPPPSSSTSAFGSGAAGTSAFSSFSGGGFGAFAQQGSSGFAAPSSSSASSSSSSPFGAPPTSSPFGTPPTTSAFSSASFGSAPVAAAFGGGGGGSAFGVVPPATSAFSNLVPQSSSAGDSLPVSTSAFGGFGSMASAFGVTPSPSASAFGNTANNAPSAFGSFANQGSSAFSQQPTPISTSPNKIEETMEISTPVAESPVTPARPSAFTTPATSSPPTTPPTSSFIAKGFGAFGNFSSGTSAFSKPPASLATTTNFGAPPSPSPTAGTPSSVFGAPSVLGSATPAFGAPSVLGAANKPATTWGGFGSPPPKEKEKEKEKEVSTSSGGAFSAFSSAGGFAALASKTTTSPFGAPAPTEAEKPKETTNIFGTPSTTSAFAGLTVGKPADANVEKPVPTNMFGTPSSTSAFANLVVEKPKVVTEIQDGKKIVAPRAGSDNDDEEESETFKGRFDEDTMANKDPVVISSGMPSGFGSPTKPSPPPAALPSTPSPAKPQSVFSLGKLGLGEDSTGADAAGESSSSQAPAFGFDPPKNIVTPPSTPSPTKSAPTSSFLGKNTSTPEPPSTPTPTPTPPQPVSPSLSNVSESSSSTVNVKTEEASSPSLLDRIGPITVEVKGEDEGDSSGTDGGEEEPSDEEGEEDSTTPTGSPAKLEATHPHAQAPAPAPSVPSWSLPTKPPLPPAATTPALGLGRPTSGPGRYGLSSVPKSSSPLAASPPISRKDVSGSPSPPKAKPSRSGGLFAKKPVEDDEEDEDEDYSDLLRGSPIKGKLKETMDSKKAAAAASSGSSSSSTSSKPPTLPSAPVPDASSTVPRVKTPPLSSWFGTKPDKPVPATEGAASVKPSVFATPLGASTTTPQSTPPTQNAFQSVPFGNAAPNLGLFANSRSSKLPPAPAPASAPKPPTPVPVVDEKPGIHSEVNRIFTIMERELEQLRTIALQCNELQQNITNSKHDGSAAFSDISQWSLGDLKTLRRRTNALEDETFVLDEQSLALRKDITELQSLLLKAETAKQEAERYLRARNDPRYAKLLKVRALGPEHTENQTRLRRSIQIAHDRVQQLEDQVATLKKKAQQAKTGQHTLKAPSLDVIARAITNIEASALENRDKMNDLTERIERLDMDVTVSSSSSPSPDPPARDSRARSTPFNRESTPLHDLLSRSTIGPRVTSASASALNAERSAARLKDVLLSARSKPLLNTSAVAKPIDPEKLEKGITVSLAVINLDPRPKSKPTPATATPKTAPSTPTPPAPFSGLSFNLPPMAALPIPSFPQSPGDSYVSPSPSPSGSPSDERRRRPTRNAMHQKSAIPRSTTPQGPSPTPSSDFFGFGSMPSPSIPVRNPLSFGFGTPGSSSSSPPNPPPLFGGPSPKKDQQQERANWTPPVTPAAVRAQEGRRIAEEALQEDEEGGEEDEEDEEGFASEEDYEEEYEEGDDSRGDEEWAQP